MDILAKMKERNTLISIGILLILFLVVLYIRTLPLQNLGTTDILNIVGSDDPLFNLRQTEQMLHNYPSYAFFEAMTLFPTGQIVPWGPLTIWMTATMSLIAGASTRNEIIGVALWLPPILAAFMVPLVFLLVRKIWNWKAGIFSAVFIAVIGGQFFFRSLAGYLDHHVAEVLFSTLFCLAYIYAISVIWKSPVDFKNPATLKRPALYSLFAGIAYVIGMLAMPTIILFAIIVSIFTIVMFMVETWQKRFGAGLLLLNTIVFGIVGLIMIFLIIPGSGLALFLYSYGQWASYLLIIMGSAVLYLLSGYFKGKNKFLFPGTIVALIIIALGAIFVIFPDLFNLFYGSLQTFFGFSPYAITIQEARPWTLGEAWQVYNFGILLIIGGILVIVYKNLKEYRPEHIFVLVWAFLIIIAAFREVRYEYYLAATIAILGGICIGFFLELAWPDIVGLGRRVAGKRQKEEIPHEKEKEPVKKKKTGAEKRAQKKQPKRSILTKTNYGTILVAGFVCAFAVIFVVTSFGMQYATASSGAIQMNQDWRESLEWMKTHTPEIGVDYYAIYNRETFTYPKTAYGVMSWWDYGHMITYIANRIPNANPFQAGVAGPNGSAAFFMSELEATTNTIANNQGTRYVMTDIEMDTGKFWAMATWYNASVGQSPYQQIFFIPTDPANPTSFQQATLYTGDYFMTMISRLHNFDGSLTPAGQVYYIEYTTTLGVGPYPVITNAMTLNATEAYAKVDQYNSQAASGYRAAVVSPVIIQPTVTVPALNHYRLVHESPTNVFGSQAAADLKYVKVFEYVPGAHIRGEGIIELPIVTNTGRQFVWQAASENGEFIVPYSTEGNPYEVKATDKYRIVNTGREISIGEDAVMNGAVIG